MDNKSLLLAGSFCLLASTSYSATEPTTPGGGGEGGAVGGGGEPLRYGYTGRGRLTFSPWDDPLYEYSLGQHQMGSNSLSKLEAVSYTHLRAHET